MPHHDRQWGISRHPVHSHHDHPVDVGWDAASGSFYGQVWGPAGDDAPPLLEVGTIHGALATVEELKEALAGHADLPAAVVRRLEEDQARHGSWLPPCADPRGRDGSSR